MKKIICCLLTVCLLASLLCMSALAADDTTINIYHTNDVHGAVSEYLGYARLKTIVEEDTADFTLLFDAGDALNGLPTASQTEGEAVARYLSAVGYDALTPGNHDFDFGWNTLLELSGEYELPYIAANVTKSEDDSMLFNGGILFDCEGITVGVLGLSTPETAYKTSVDKVAGIDFGTEDELFDTAREYVAEIKERGADVVIALAHLGSDAYFAPSSVELATAVPGIDVIIDGHSHSVLPCERVGDTIITSCGEYMQYLGCVSITVGAGGVGIESYVNPYTDYADVVPDAGIEALTEEINTELEPVLGEVLLKTDAAMDGVRANVRSVSTDLGRAVTAAMMNATGADMAMINGGTIRTSLPAGDVTRGDLVAVLPFGNYVVKVAVTGQDIIDTLNDVMICGQGSYPQFYGMDVTATKLTIPYTGGTSYNRYEVESVTVDGEPIDPAKTYTLAINDYMYTGNDSYSRFAGKLVGEYGTVMDAFIDYMRGDYTAAAANNNLTLNELYTRFTDISSHWAYDSICGIVSMGYLNGVSRTAFAPDDYVNRAMAVTALYRAAGVPEPEKSETFSDVTEDAWYFASTAWALESGVASGVGEGRFAPLRDVTREELAVFMYRLAGNGGELSSITPLDGYTDTGDISDFAVEAMRWAVGAGIIKGVDEDTLAPGGNATRAQLAVMLERFTELYA